MWSDDRAIAVLCADIHLSLNPPAARRGEPDWFGAMAHTLYQVRDLADELDHVPIICAGDVFDRWNSPPELVNFALQELPMMYAIPGQHDLPLHRMDLIKKSAFWTLVIAGKLIHLDGRGIQYGGLMIHGFGWGSRITLPPDDAFEGIRLAVIHDFIWTGTYGYPGASDTSKVKHFRKNLVGYSAAVFGDNHKGFLVEHPQPVLNCGGLFRRKSDEIGYRPSVGILCKSGKITRHYLDTTGECIESVVEESERAETDFGDFLADLSSLTSDPLSFAEAMKHAMAGCPEGVRRILEGVVT